MHDAAACDDHSLRNNDSGYLRHLQMPTAHDSAFSARAPAVLSSIPLLLSEVLLDAYNDDHDNNAIYLQAV